jgi:hypothetical protein
MTEIARKCEAFTMLKPPEGKVVIDDRCRIIGILADAT